MKGPDLDRERSERRVTLATFLAEYNDKLPEAFPRASLPLLREYRTRYPGQFKADGLWSLDEHRKRFMDWLPAYLKTLEA
ncbi:MAG: hypothetical protein KGI78_04110 [Patescibacteria group bacterium]|nr:hypothetical protein [Patescibacteria group bacterium]MDE1944572.1 hypothetical protein [Patescibacteria group bacterium]MDE1945428.1 hypothetical protein [Patescibacteria group bacterium]MDE2058004.1 hypothetical protein [Patescibacteria group bacterium]